MISAGSWIAVCGCKGQHSVSSFSSVLHHGRVGECFASQGQTWEVSCFRLIFLRHFGVGGNHMIPFNAHSLFEVVKCFPVTLAAVLTPPLGVELFSPEFSKCYSAASTGILDDLHISCATQHLSPVEVQLPLPRFVTPILTFHKVMLSVVSLPRQALRSELLLLTWQSELTTVLSPCPWLSKCGKQKLNTKSKFFHQSF